MDNFLGKVVVVGDQSVGKTSLLNVLHRGKYSQATVPPEGFFRIFDYDKEKHTVYFWDTAGNTDYDRLRPLSYPDTHLFLILFDISNRQSFDAVRTRWIPELQHHCPKVPYMIVGTKIDTRSDPNIQAKTIAFEEGEQLARDVKSQFRYLEVSAKDNVGLNELLNAIKVGVLMPEKEEVDNKRRCILM